MSWSFSFIFLTAAFLCCPASGRLGASATPGSPNTGGEYRADARAGTIQRQRHRGQSGSGTIQLGLLDAIDRGLKHNLGLLLSQQQSELARAQYRRQLSALLPNVSGNVSESLNQINLAAFGIPLPRD